MFVQQPLYKECATCSNAMGSLSQSKKCPQKGFLFILYFALTFKQYLKQHIAATLSEFITKDLNHLCFIVEIIVITLPFLKTCFIWFYVFLWEITHPG